MENDTVDLELPAETPLEIPRDCHMSLELYQNARQTMGELRDLIRQTGISWECLQAQIARADSQASPIEKAFDRMDEYSTGTGRSLHDKEHNVW